MKKSIIVLILVFICATIVGCSEDTIDSEYDYSKVEFIWQEITDGYQVEAVIPQIGNEENKLRLTATVTKVVENPTCEEEGQVTYKATIKDSEGNEYTAEKVDKIQALGHNWVKKSAVVPTFDDKGYSNYECSNCGLTKIDDYLDEIEVKYTIKIHAYNNIVQTIRIAEDGKYKIEAPVRVGYSLTRLEDADGNAFTAYEGTTSKNFELFAKWDPKETTTIEEFVEYAAGGANEIKLVNDIVVDRPIYIVGQTTIYSDSAVTIKRAKNYSGELFIIGETEDGTNVLLNGAHAFLNIGKYGENNNITIDGNKDEMTVNVSGSALFITNSSMVNINNGIVIENCKKESNDKLLNDTYYVSSPNRAGGAVGVIVSGILNIYEATIRNNAINDENTVDSEDEEEASPSSFGGAFYNYGNIYIYGGVFENNYAARGGVIANYRMLKVYSGRFKDNTASKYAGAIYNANSQYAEVLLGLDSESVNEFDVTFDNNIAIGSGGAIFSQTSSVVIIFGKTLFKENKTNEGNGGVINASGTLTILGGMFQSNYAYSKGGAIHVYNSDDTKTTRIVEIRNTEFVGNQANRGGAFSAYASEDTLEEGAIVIVKNSLFNGNSAIDTTIDSSGSSMHGGAMYISRKSNVEIIDSQFVSNTARNEGGAIYGTGDSKISIKGTEFSSNSNLDDEENAGTISIHSVDLSITSSRFVNNATVGNGGAIYVSYASASTDDSKLFVDDSIFENNSALGYGGAIYVTGRTGAEVTINIKNSEFNENVATGNGGAIYLKTISAYIYDSYFNENKSLSTTYGGAAIYSTGATLEINKASFVGNESSFNGGAIAGYSSSAFVFNEITATGNSAAKNGGAIFAKGTTLDLYSSILNSNEAYGGGAIYLDANAVINGYANEFKQNEASNNGGAMYLYMGGTTQSIMYDTLFESNTSLNFGGAFYASSASLIKFINTTASMNNAVSGGYAYITTTNTEITLNGITVSQNSATNGPIIYGNTTKAKLKLNKSNYTDLQVSEIDTDYWATAIANKLSVEDYSETEDDYDSYTHDEEEEDEPVSDATPVQTILALASNSSEESIDATFDTYSKPANLNNFSSDSVEVYENINGKDVIVDSIVFLPYDIIGNPNLSAGLLILQAMQYKDIHKDEEVYIDFSTFHLSVYAAICINRDSRYFGYMRSLPNSEYDEFGFVRISYLLVMAAKMGIHVTVLGQIDSVAMILYNDNNELEKISDGDFEQYFNTHLNDICDVNYVPGNKSIKEYLNFHKAKWTSYGDDAATDMLHVKTCTVSNYIDMNGVEHEYGVFFSSINLDSINYKGWNSGNIGAQTATIITNHEYIYRVTHNYVSLMSQYMGQEDVYILREIVNQRVTNQIRMIKEGKLDDIPADELIVYLGTEEDSIFELYFTPLGGAAAVWDEVYNPYCKYINQIVNSTGTIKFDWTTPKLIRTLLVDSWLQKIFAAFAERTDAYSKAKFMVNAGLNTEGLSVPANVIIRSDIYYHSKDLLLDYENELGERQYVVILSSCNIHNGSMSWQFNQILVIKTLGQQSNMYYDILRYLASELM
ncbi:MAG: hypothetical protein K5923_00245 [Clostridia bacterium]|nr:hypothetical protein [Clostridia bacterium]